MAPAPGGDARRCRYGTGAVWRARRAVNSTPAFHVGALGGQDREALGRSRGGFSTKIHVRAEGGGKPMALVLSGGERHESRYVEALLTHGHVWRAGRGRPRLPPGRIVGDKGYSYPPVRRLLAQRGIRAVIPRRRDQRPDGRRHGEFDQTTYRERNRIERLVNRLKQCRRIATRYDKRAAHYLAMLTLAGAVLWLDDATTRRPPGCAQGRRRRL